MFNSISNIFSLPALRKNKYEIQPSFKQFLKKNKIGQTLKQQTYNDPYFDSFIQCLKTPIEQWILHQQTHLKTFTINKKIFELVIQNSKKSKLSSEQQSKITVHNLFVLLVQYQVLSEFIKQMQTTQLQLLIDGACGIYLKNNTDSLQQLTCVLHHILTKSKMHRTDKNSSQIIIFKALNIVNISNFLQIYKDLPSRLSHSYFDTIVRVIPMFSELLKIIIKTNSFSNRFYILKQIHWITQIGPKLLELICKDINEIITKQTESIQFQTISYDEENNPTLKKRLVQFAKKACKIAGFVSNKQLFIYACRQLYFFQHVVRLYKHILELVFDIEQVNSEYQKCVITFIKQYLKILIEYDVNLPDNYLQSILNIFKFANFSYNQDITTIGLEVSGNNLKNFIKVIQSCQIYQWQSRVKDKTVINQQKIQFYFEREQTILSFIIRFIFNLQVQYIEILNIIIQNSNANFLIFFQYYLIKNGLLHFLIEEQQAILGNDQKMHKNYFKIITYLVKNNGYTYKILDEILQKNVQKNQRYYFIDEIRKSFYASKQFLMSVLADTITINSKMKQKKLYFLPYSLQALLYQQQKEKHDIWISYIHDVIIRDLSSTQQKKVKIGKKDMNLQKDIHQWITIAMMLQIQYVLHKRGEDFQLGQFTMNYLTNILNQAIKWKYQDETETMRRIMRNYENWEEYYTEIILNNQNNQDIIETKLGETINFLFLRKWNRKICNAIKTFIESVESTTILQNQVLLF